MIHTSKQLKDKVRNLSLGDNDKAKILIRNFVMGKRTMFPRYRQ